LIVDIFHLMAKDGKNRRDIRPGMTVDAVLKQDQPTGKRTRGEVAAILTNSPQHPHGIKVRLKSGQVGRVQEIIE
jgi:uncharacterized repeat protein (TIGR03833 family)